MLTTTTEQDWKIVLQVFQASRSLHEAAPSLNVGHAAADRVRGDRSGGLSLRARRLG
jgi:hypothetical protein